LKNFFLLKSSVVGLLIFASLATVSCGQGAHDGTPHGAQPQTSPTTPELQSKPGSQVPEPGLEIEILGSNEFPDLQRTGLVKAVSRPFLKGISYSYNASIANYDGKHFLMVFRVDVGEVDPVYPITKIGLVKLDENLNQVSETRFIITGLKTAEDARIFKKGDEFWIVFNARRGDELIRAMYVARLEGLESGTGDIQTDPVLLDFERDKPQKNWVPFVHDNTIYFSYSLTPHKVLRYNEKTKKVEMVHETHSVGLSNGWQFGALRGGTPALLRGDEYLAFYHSNVSKNNHFWYVFGAYTFEAKPPFKLKQVCERPVYFRDNYTSMLQPHIGPTNRVSFPAGIAAVGDRILVSYGENDSQTKIVTFDAKLLDEMFKSPKPGDPKVRAFEPDLNIGVPLPIELKSVPFLDESSDKSAVVKNIKRIILFDALFPMDGSIIALSDGYLLAYTVLTDKVLSGGEAQSEIRVVNLDRNFIQKGPSRQVAVWGISPKRPRLFYMRDTVYMAFNATREQFFGKRGMYAGRLERLAPSVHAVRAEIIKFGYDFDQENWSPFVYNEELHFSYLVEPHHVLRFNGTNTKVIESEISKAGVHWPFGPIEGGTPGVKWNGEYLAFFQSSFMSGSHRWNVMGAYTFENKPPFRVTRISKEPILLRDFYTTNPQPGMNRRNRIVFPAGLVIQDGIIQVSYGENDSSVKILELDEDEFAKTLNSLVLPAKAGI
jgi:predicted GH43/DUF377 family glycosyl hydrolase